MKTQITLDELRADIVAAYPRIVDRSGRVRTEQIEVIAPELWKKIYTKLGGNRQRLHTAISEMRRDGLIPKIGASANGSSLVRAQRGIVVGTVTNPDPGRGDRRTQMMVEAHASAGVHQKIKWSVLKRENNVLYQQLLGEYGGVLSNLRAGAARYRKLGLFKKPSQSHTNGHAPLNVAARPVAPVASPYAINRCPHCGMNIEGLSKAMLILSKLGPEKINAVLAGLQNLEQ